jgi:hypothetical protein
MRAWNVLTQQIDPQESITCAICRFTNDGACATCESSESTSLSFEEWCRKTLFTLLCARKRAESPLSLLDTCIISKIYAFSIERGEVDTTCFVTETACGHRFHTHCLDAWYKRRRSNPFLTDLCPLCNQPIHESSDCISLRSLEWKGTLLDCAVYSEPFETRIKRKRREERADAGITKLLKQGGSYTEEEIAVLIPGDVKEALRSLVERGFIFESGDGKYNYFPSE